MSQHQYTAFNYSPSVVNTLKALNPNLLNHEYYKLRHPGAIYNLMINNLAESLLLLIDAIKNKEQEAINSAFRITLYDFFKFYESCFEILLTLTEKHVHPRKGEFIYKWLKKNNYSVGEDFFKYTNEQVLSLKEVYNDLKHSSNELQFITFRNQNEESIAYFVQKVHYGYERPIKPVSLLMEIRRMHFLIYHISHELEIRILNYFNKKYIKQGLSLTENRNPAFVNLFSSIKELSEFYFLNEIGDKVVRCSFDNNSIIFSEEIIQSKELYESYYKTGINLSMIIKADGGYHNTIKIPYCGLIQNGKDFYFENENKELIQLKIIP